ncbi:hypothetical protein [Sulfoacidibacillus thermotolerans]|uniref:Blue (type 1) copper domain-containing protein n=1 Tax=Sulfoacidibacillus thermotolerans TaxID=1765684 RepID=A0A2U3D966_SULT2|nr:hypothetical protein [Sulfoacidibacillus thermotolerans]PWI57819.1 hypothetical protein BM613_06405 [Sulfoacidibacillus thermotolerans]
MSKTVDSEGRFHRDTDWQPGVFFGVLALVLLIGVAVLFGRFWIAGIFQKAFDRVPTQGTVHVFQFDYAYEPRHITWRVGDRVTIALRNMSDTHWHEMVIGRGYDTVPSAFGAIATQFKTDFWDGVPVRISNAHHVDNLVLNKARATFVGSKPNLATGGDFSPTLQPGGSINLTFTVPNKPGEWQYGCFVQQYMHYVAGMNGTITILPAK